jgi:hypothetical protein
VDVTQPRRGARRGTPLTLRLVAVTYARIASASCASGTRLLIGMSRDRVSSSAEWSEKASRALGMAASRRGTAGASPEVETVMEEGGTPKPRGSLRQRS